MSVLSLAMQSNFEHECTTVASHFECPVNAVSKGLEDNPAVPATI